MAAYDFDLFTIGAGSGGVRASRLAAAHGARVAIVEERYLGGTCVNAGCIPNKLLVYAATRPDNFRIQRTTSIKAPPDKIFPLIDDLHAHTSWSPFEKDPAMKRTHSGAPLAHNSAADSITCDSKP